MSATKGKKETRNYQTLSKTMNRVLARGVAHVGLNPAHQSSVDVGSWKKKTGRNRCQI